MRRGGWAALIVLVLVTLVLSFTANLLGKSFDALCAGPFDATSDCQLDFGSLGYRAFGNPGYVFIQVVAGLEMWLAALDFYLLVADSCSDVFGMSRYWSIVSSSLLSYASLFASTDMIAYLSGISVSAIFA